MRIMIIALLALLVGGFASAADSGLEVNSGTKIYVLVENLSDDAKATGLTKEFIASKTELQLRRNGVPVGSRKNAYASGVHLYVNCGVTGKAFALSVEFRREVSYRAGGQTHSVMSSTYNQGGQGTHSGDRQFIVQTLTDFLDVFSNDFLKSNPVGKASNKINSGDGK